MLEVVRARALAKRLNGPICIVNKRRERAGESEVVNVIGQVEGQTCVLIDDIVDSGGTLINAASALLQRGAIRICAYATHGVLWAGAPERFACSSLSELTITDSIQPTAYVKNTAKFRYMFVTSMSAETAKKQSHGSSMRWFGGVSRRLSTERGKAEQVDPYPQRV